EMHSSDPSKARDWGVPFRPEPCLTGPEIEAWEAANGVLLPQEYRLFLLEVGNGGRIAYSDYRDFEIWPLGAKGGGFTLGTVPITRSRLRERLAQGQVEVREGSPYLFPELAAHRSEGWPLPGCLHFGTYPGGDGVFMVIAGELCGTIWTAVDDGVPECDRSSG